MRNRRTRKVREKQELDFTERSTRLVLSLTVLGGIFGVLGTIYINIFTHIFTSTLYLDFYIRSTHLMVLCFGTFTSIIILRVLLYIIAEFSSFNIDLNKTEENKQIVIKANKSYGMIIKALKNNFIIAAVISALYMIIEELYFKNGAFIALIVFLVIIAIVFIMLYLIKTSWGQIKNNILSTIKIIPYKDIGLFGFVFLLWLFVGVGLMGFKQPIEVSFTGTELNINLENIAPKTVKIDFIASNGQEETLTKSLSLIEKDFKLAFQEVVMEDIEGGNFLNKLMMPSPERNRAIKKDNTRYNYQYKIDYSDYIKNGQNYVVITFSTQGLMTKNSKIVNPVYLEDEKYEIQQMNFQIN
ncbi:hypothetical protein [Paenibacillus massiliensis]|uniref:hypothetical protein n=1 Tax=Paenibacillus massiliensis TaxID=225917 RepID=UPI00046E9546|nr:hypothetical protein [Paenibacillus massiliensis]